MSKTRILLVEDDVSLGKVTKDYLQLYHYEVILCEDGELGFKTFQETPFDLCILDIMLPRKDGFSLAREIRELNSHVPIIFLTARSLAEDKIAGFKTGGDDYLVKPFNFEELLLRIEVFLKRSRKVDHLPEVFVLGAYTFDYPNVMLVHGKEQLLLTQKEADILQIFCLQLGNMVKREEILVKVWGENDYFLGRSLDVFISKLRKYLKQDPSIEIINQHGIGFKLIVKK